MKNDETRVNELTVALRTVEQKLAERDVLINTAFSQTEAARAQYEQANERAESLRRRLENKDEQLATLQQTLQQRDERIAALELLCAESDNTLHAINQDVKLQNLTNPGERPIAMSMALESLDDPGVQYPIGRLTTTLGRATGNDIAINSTSVSRYHARIVVASDGTYLIDLQSTNGCSVNGQRAIRQRITDGDVISIGNAKFQVTADGAISDTEDRSMDETLALLDDAEIFIPAPKTATAMHEPAKAKAK